MPLAPRPWRRQGLVGHGHGRSVLLAIDAGTTGITAIVYDNEGRRQGHAYSEFPSTYPEPGWVEQDPHVILDTTQRVAHDAVQQVGVPADTLAIGITNQRETTIVWDDQGRAIAPAIVWQDRRTSPRCQELAPEAKRIGERTGLVVDAYFSATKLEWILDHVDGARAQAKDGKLHFGTVDSWLAWHLTGRHVTDHTNASRTMLYDIHRSQWDPDLLDLFDVPAAMLPDVLPSAGSIGQVQQGPLAGAHLCGLVGDQQGALFGQACTAPGDAKVTYGTGAFFLQHTGAHAPAPQGGLVTTHAASHGPAQYAIEGSVFIAGAAIQWLRDGLQLIDEAPQINALAADADDDVVFVPAFNGLGAPYWDSHARGAILGLTQRSGRPELARATLRAIAQQTCDLIEAAEAISGLHLDALRVDGGAAHSDLLLQMQADLLQRPVQRPIDVETTARGAAGLAAIGDGRRDEPLPLEADAIRQPTMSHEGAAAQRARWAKAVAATRAF